MHSLLGGVLSVAFFLVNLRLTLFQAILVPFCAKPPQLHPLALALLPDSPATLLNLPNQLQGWKKVFKIIHLKYFVNSGWL